MSEQQNLRLVQQFYAAFQRGDIAGVLNAFADDVALFIPGPKEIIPCVGQRQGREQVAQFFATLAEMQDAEQFELRELIAQGNKVVGTKLASLELRELVRSLVQQIQIGEAQILVRVEHNARRASQANRFCRTFRPVDHRKPSPGWKGCAAGDRQCADAFAGR
jgi:ketosteroid isomerase-like protein